MSWSLYWTILIQVTLASMVLIALLGIAKGILTQSPTDGSTVYTSEELKQ